MNPNILSVIYELQLSLQIKTYVVRFEVQARTSCRLITVRVSERRHY